MVSYNDGLMPDRCPEKERRPMRTSQKDDSDSWLRIIAARFTIETNCTSSCCALPSEGMCPRAASQVYRLGVWSIPRVAALKHEATATTFIHKAARASDTHTDADRDTDTQTQTQRHGDTETRKHTHNHTTHTLGHECGGRCLHWYDYDDDDEDDDDLL